MDQKTKGERQQFSTFHYEILEGVIKKKKRKTQEVWGSHIIHFFIKPKIAKEVGETKKKIKKKKKESAIKPIHHHHSQLQC